MRPTLLLLVLPFTALAAPALPAVEQPQFDATLKFLHRYGYLGSTQPSLHELREALIVFQEVAGIDQTGELDEATLSAQKRSRCVHSDTHRTHGGRSKRFVMAASSKWKHYSKSSGELHLKWHVSQYTKDLADKTTRSTIHKAFQLWASQTNIPSLPKVQLHFEEVSRAEDADINIMWVEGEHGDSHEFDGAVKDDTNVLAHTFYPGYKEPLNGDIHFDDAEQWAVDPNLITEKSEYRFFPYVLAHEIGHALGLHHSRNKEAIMNPYYRNTPLDQLKLDIDDKCGINWNYAGPSNLCLFVWLMSEIVPLHHNMNQEMSNPPTSTHMLHSNNRFSTKRTKNTRIPRCTSSNELKTIAEKRLHRNLHFSHEDAKKWSEVVCNFLVGLHIYRGNPNYIPHDSLEREYKAVKQEVDNFSASPSAVRRLVRKVENGEADVFDPSFFDKKFFDEFLQLYTQS